MGPRILFLQSTCNLVELEDIILFHFSKEYISSDPPRVVLNKIEQLGYKVIASTGVGQTIIWTLHKPDEETSDKVKADR